MSRGFHNTGLCTLLTLLLTLTMSVFAQKRLICLDNKQDVDTSGWRINTEVKSAANAAALPKAFGELGALDGSGIWYFEGPTVRSTSIKEVTFQSSPSLYTSRAKSVQIYIKYYDLSPRRVSLLPAKTTTGSTGGPLLLLPLSLPNQWSEIRQEIDPSESPIELTANLGTNQFILFEKVVVAIDTPLPSDLSRIPCQTLLTPPTVSPNPSSGAGSPGPRSPIPTSPIVSRPSTPSASLFPRADCPAVPVFPECKCNCVCNCAKC